MKQFVRKLKETKFHEILFYIFLFLIPVQTRILYWPEKAYISWYFNYHQAFFVYLTDLVLVSCILIWFLFDKPKLHWDRIFLLIIGLFGLILATLFHVKRIDLGLIQAFHWAEVLVIVLYIRHTFSSVIKFHVSAWILYISAGLQAILGIWQFHVQHMIGFTWFGEYIAPMGTAGLATIVTLAGKTIRAYGTFSHPNVLAGFLIVGIFLGFWLILRETSPVKHRFYVKHLVVLAIQVVLILGLFFTFSRTAWLALGLGFLAYIWYCFAYKNKKGLILGLFIGIVSCGTIFLGYSDYLSGRSIDSSSVSVIDRVFFNSLGLDLIGRFPVLGAGVGNYVEALLDLTSLEAWQYQPAHNVFIFIGAELGILGLGLFILVLYEIFSRLRPKFDSLTFILAALGLVLILVGQFDHYFATIQQGRLMFATILGLLAALPNLYATNERID